MRFRFPRGRRRAWGLNHILGTGQSLAIGTSGTPVLSTTQPYANKMFSVPANPLTLTSLNSLVESVEETMSSGMANLVTDLADGIGVTHDALVSVAGSGGSDYDTIKKGTATYTAALAQITAGLARAGELSKTYGVPCVTCVHGEADGNAGSLVYDADLIEWQADYEADIKAISGQTGAIPMLHSQMSAIAGNDVPLAQLRAHVARPGRIILVGPKYHLPDVDGSHLTNHGYRQLGEYYAKVIYRAILRGERWEPVRPMTVSRAGAVVTVQFHVPVAPLVFDTTLVPATTNQGFEWSGGGETISSVAITASDTVQVTLSATPSPGGRIKYAQNASIRGNLRDSDTTESLNGYDLYNWCCHFDEVVS